MDRSLQRSHANPRRSRSVRHLRLPEDDSQCTDRVGRRRGPRTASPSIKGPAKDEPPGRYFDVMLRLEDRPALRAKLEIYCTKAWFEWSETEKPRRRSIAVYQRLFEIAQRLLQSGGRESVELIWGLGLARWSRPRGVDRSAYDRARRRDRDRRPEGCGDHRSTRAARLRASSFAPSKNLPLKDWRWRKTLPSAALRTDRGRRQRGRFSVPP